jgi:hypothetical protein
MRDLVVREALQAMARDAAKRFREQVASGGEIPYDIVESGDGSPLPQYTPLTERFVREHAPLLRELDSFGAACAAIESAELASPYLAEMGIDAPPDARRRAEMAGVVFLCRLWQDSTDFSLDEERLRGAIAELEANGDPTEAEIEVVVPLRGLRMEGTRVELATATIVRADTVDVPAEARSPEASGGAGWEPTFVAFARVPAASDFEEEEATDPGARAVEAYRSLITTLRLFKEGGVALGPHAWTRVGGGRWRRISTGAGRPRPGGYRLAESELSELAGFSRAIVKASVGATGGDQLPAGALGRAIGRFEAGLDRAAPVDALNDYLLALRFLLEGGGPADLGLSMRVASLVAEPDERSGVKATIDRALALERELWSGEPPAALNGAQTPADTAADVEDLARAILKDAACGHLGFDLRATADEILLADGLAIGDGSADQRGETAEWDGEPIIDAEAQGDPEADHEAEPETRPFTAPQVPAEPDVFDEPLVVEPVAPRTMEPTEPEAAEPAGPVDDGPRYGREEPVVPAQAELWFDGAEPDDDDEPELQVIHQPERMKLSRTSSSEEEPMIASAPTHTERDGHETRTMAPVEPAEVGGESPVSHLIELHRAEREAARDRVANLFPRPETTEWNVREINYDRNRRANVGT